VRDMFLVMWILAIQHVSGSVAGMLAIQHI
jgi:hypothetical protein